MLLLEVGTSCNRERYDNRYQPGILAERGTTAWYRNLRKDDTSTGYLWNASSAQLGNYPDRYNEQGSISHVTGGHNVKFGVMNQFDISVSKSVEFGALRVTPKLDIFNALNSDDYTSVVSARYGTATYRRPSVVLQGRIVRIGADIRW